VHGHTFDDFLDNHPFLTWLGDCIYFFLQWLDRTHSLARRAKHGCKTFLRCAQKVEDGAIALARQRDCQAVCCGHTHAACARPEQPVPYFNSGCWTERPCTYLTVADGVVSMHAFSEDSFAGIRVQGPGAREEEEAALALPAVPG
jgi:UDP-2,3-diacylglucosamine pyrophosphatase LpxH